MGDRRISAQRAEPAPLVLIVDDDPEITALLTELLTGDGLRCETASDGQTAVELATRLRPQLVLLDLSLPVLSGDEVFKRLRADHRTRYIPIVFLTAAGNRKAVIGHLLAGGDDYVTKPFDIDELSARVQATLRRARTLGGLNPISGLPGNSAIHEEMTERLRAGRAFACVYLDIDHFKPFNDHYGFTRGDTLILALAEAIFAAVETAGSEAFLGHVGGDDFVMLCEPDEAEALAADVIARFGSAARSLHDEADALTGGYEAEDRRGVRMHWPLASLSAGIAVSGDRYPSAAALAQAAAEMKTHAKRGTGGRVAIDRRHAQADEASGGH